MLNVAPRRTPTDLPADPGLVTPDPEPDRVPGNVSALVPPKPGRGAPLLRPEDPGTTYLFTDIEGSTALWEREPARMAPAMARHDALSRAAVAAHRGRVVKGTGDGIHAIFADPLDAVLTALQIQQAMAEPVAPGDLELRVRCGMHCGSSEARDGDYYGPALNRAARVMSAAHGGQTLLTQEVSDRLVGRLPDPLSVLDLGAVRLRDLGGPQPVHQLVHPGLRERFPPLRSMEATPNNLVQQLNSFVGRERELAEVRALLGRTRLLTLLGMGGIGKSRLSVQLGAELLEEYPDGVWLVELAPVTDALRVPQALATVLGVREEAGRSVTAALLSYVRDKSMLVILDNCEHVVDACAGLAKQLLQGSNRLKVLASSRDVLEVGGEVVYQVPTLSVPAPDATAAELTRHEAVRLFLDRAAAVRPGFQLAAENTAAVADICRQLDGIPLALELAAARVRVLSVQAIAGRLSDRFRLLVSGDKTVLPRQRTLRALIDWSFDLLSEDERALFRRLSVFAGGWTLDAAEVVCGTRGIERGDVLDLLAHLVEKSLVVMDVDGSRYRMLETVRAYAHEKLVEAGDEPEAARQQAEYFLALAETARPQLAGPEQGQWLAILDADRDNLMAAADRLTRPDGDHTAALRIVFALRIYWINRGELSVGLSLAMKVLTSQGLADRNASRCMALFNVGQLCFFMGRNEDARKWLEECLDIARQIDAPTIVARTLQPLGMANLALGDFAASARCLHEAVEMAKRVGDERDNAAAMNALAMLYRQQGEYELALPICEEVVRRFESAGDRENIGVGLLSTAMVAVQLQRLEDAASMLQRAVGIARETGSLPLLVSSLEARCGLMAAQGRWTEAALSFGAAQAQRQRAGSRRDAADEAFVSAAMLRTGSALAHDLLASQSERGRSLTRLELLDRLANVG